MASPLQQTEATLADLKTHDVVARIWRGDHTVWKPASTEITDRLGWLTVTETMRARAASLAAFAREVRDDGIRHVVLLGMGGSSLGPEVFRQTFGSAAGYPETLVLDTTVPAAVRAAARVIKPDRTLFLVSSKSGGTIETMSLYKYFNGLVEKTTSRDSVGRHFVAITDAGTSLEKLAREHAFRRTFVNPPDIGGRFSVLSYFGLVPAALAGLDVATLLDRAERVRAASAPSVPIGENPGARLGARVAAHATQGRDKLTLVASPAIASFGLWVEQLVAESTGKEGKGVIPVVGEPLVSPAAYSDDRLFVYLRLDGDGNAATDAAMSAIEAAGRPVVRLVLRDRYDLGAEFFRWEFATAVTGAVMGIHPFDQPDVQQAKDMTARVLDAYRASGGLPRRAARGSLPALLASVKRGDYLAIMAYVRQTPQTDMALAKLRRAVIEGWRVATTVGYGPRFLHSTGQLHKGGPSSGLFLQLTSPRGRDLPIPGEPYTFGVLADAQALGDMEALRGRGRRVAHVRTGRDVARGVRDLAGTLRKERRR